jgi:hypothetical protein
VHPLQGVGVEFASALARTLAPVASSEWARLAGLAVIGLMSGAGAAAYLLARHGLRRA